jgi:hypothetical protein
MTVLICCSASRVVDRQKPASSYPDKHYKMWNRDDLIILVSAFVISGTATNSQYFGFSQITDKLLSFISVVY